MDVVGDRCCTIVASSSGGSVLSLFSARGVQDDELWTEITFHLAQAVLNLLLLEVGAANTRVLGAVEHRILQVKAALSCKAVHFFEEVHAPCAELVHDTGPQMAPLGFPLPYFAMNLLMNGGLLYQKLLITLHSPDIPWLDSSIAGYTLVEGVISAFAIAVAPLRISAALGGLCECLGKVRSESPELHVQVQTVEVMLERSNNGHGWGIHVGQGVVVNKELLQTVCVRVLLMATAFFAFIRSSSGFEKAEDNDAAIADMKDNISSILSILSDNKVNFHKRE